jgi:menaquinol-cytochrome c reductase iron-sulfur subunit
MSDTEKINRKQFMEVATWSIGGLIGLIMGIPAIAYIVGPALSKREESDWIRLGSTSKVEIGTPTLFKVKMEHQTGWITEAQEHSIFVLTNDGREFIAMSNICTHLGCRVRWIADQEVFLSPCHNGIFDKQGYVVSGPPPRPLDRYEIKIERDQLFVGRLYQVTG